MTDFAALGQLTVIDAVDIEADLKARMAKFKALWAAYDPPLGVQYDVDATEFDPIKINQEVNSYFAAMLRDRINQAVRATSVFTARGPDLDIAVSRLTIPVARLPGEGDDRFIARALAAQGSFSTAGAEEAYTSKALAAEPSLSDASAIDERPTPDDPTVVVTCLSERPEMIPTDGELNNVRAVLFAKNVKPLSTTLYVRAPDIVDVDWAVTVWLYPGVDTAETLAAIYAPATDDTPESGRLADLKAELRKLGADSTLNAIGSAARGPGVQNVHVTSPPADVPVSPRQIARVNSITVVLAGAAE